MAKPATDGALASSLSTLARDLIDDYHDLRKGKLSVREARARAGIAREAMRAVHLQFEGLKFLSAQAKQIEGGK